MTLFVRCRVFDPSRRVADDVDETEGERAVMITDERISFVGATTDAVRHFQADIDDGRIEVVDGHGSALLCPGFVDSHLHILYSGRLMLATPLDTVDAAQVDALCAAFSEAHQRSPADWWLAGQNLKLTEPTSPVGPNGCNWAAALDAALPGRCIIAEYHPLPEVDPTTSAWYLLIASYAALAAAGVIEHRDDAGDDAGAQWRAVQRFQHELQADRQGRLTGLAWGSARMAVLTAFKTSPGMTARSYDAAAALLNRHGVTCCHTTSTPYSTCELQQVAQLREHLQQVLARSSRAAAAPASRSSPSPVPSSPPALVRVRYITRMSHAADLLRWTADREAAGVGAPPFVTSAEAAAAPPRSLDAFLKTGMLKGFADGTLGYNSAAMSTIAPADAPAARVRYETDELAASFAHAMEHGLQPCVHAMGDSASRCFVAAWEMACALRGVDPAAASVQFRPRIEHGQYLSAADVAAVAAAGITVSAQPPLMISDWAASCALQAETSTSKHILPFPFASLSRAGVPLAFGSDWDVGSTLSVMDGLRLAATRSHQGSTMGPREERLSLHDSLVAYTSAGAVASFDDRAGYGAVVVGAPADLVLLRQDPRLSESDPSAVTDERCGPVLTMVAGRVVYKNDATFC